MSQLWDGQAGGVVPGPTDNTLCIAEFTCSKVGAPLVCEVRLGRPSGLQNPRLSPAVRAALEQSKRGTVLCPIRIVKVY